MLSEQEHGVKVHRQQVWPDAEYQTAAELLLPGAGDLPAPAEWQEVLPHLEAEPDVTAPTLLPEHAPKLCLLCSSLLATPMELALGVAIAESSPWYVTRGLSPDTSLLAGDGPELLSIGVTCLFGLPQ